jgi:hypothetical protein
MFPSPNILQHYIEFNTHTITMLEKLLGVESFGGSISRLVHHQAILLAFKVELDLPSIIQIISLAFLGC